MRRECREAASTPALGRVVPGGVREDFLEEAILEVRHSLSGEGKRGLSGQKEYPEPTSTSGL